MIRSTFRENLRPTRDVDVAHSHGSLVFDFVTPPPNLPQTIQYKGVTSIIYKTKDLAPRSQTLNWLGLTRSHTEAVTLSRMADRVSVMDLTLVGDEKRRLAERRISAMGRFLLPSLKAEWNCVVKVAHPPPSIELGTP